MRVLACIAALLFAVSAYAQNPPYALNFGQVCPGSSSICQSVVPRKIITFDFTAGSLPSGVTFSRSSTAWYFNSSGLLTSASTNTPRFDYGTPGSSTLQGLLAEKGNTNNLLWSRDFTQASWTASSITAALDQTGIDGVASSASSLTATGTNGTICQTITQAATLSTFSVYMKRIVGTGTISISQDGGSTYSNVTPTSSWARFSHATQSTLNPGICIRIGTSGDAVAVDVAQFEGGGGDFSYATSPIITTSATVTRAADSVTITPSWYNVNSGAFVYQYEQVNFGGAVVGLGGFNNAGYSWNVNNNNLTIAGGIVGSPLFNTPNFVGITYAAPSGVISSAFNGTSHAGVSGIPAAPTVLSLGGGSSWIRSFKYWNFSITPAQLQAQTR